MYLRSNSSVAEESEKLVCAGKTFYGIGAVKTGYNFHLPSRFSEMPGHTRTRDTLLGSADVSEILSFSGPILFTTF